MKKIIVPKGTHPTKFPPFSSSGEKVDISAWARYLGNEPSSQVFEIMVPDDYSWDTVKNEYGEVAP